MQRLDDQRQLTRRPVLFDPSTYNSSIRPWDTSGWSLVRCKACSEPVRWRRWDGIHWGNRGEHYKRYSIVDDWFVDMYGFSNCYAPTRTTWHCGRGVHDSYVHALVR